MCTVSVFADPGGAGYLLACNRDESLRRARAEPPAVRLFGGRRAVSPLDPDGGGAWIGVDEQGLTVCLLNGDRGAAAPPPPDVASRGLVVGALLGLGDAHEAARAVMAMAEAGRVRTRPFLLVLASPAAPPAGVSLVEVSFDGARAARRDVGAPHVATSSTLDPDGAARARGGAFRDLVARLDALPRSGRREAVLRWHAHHLPEEPGGGPLSVCMHRPEARTVSRTVVEVRGGRASVGYHDGWPCRPAEETEVDLALAGS